jgi:flagellar biosynthetic protein FliR
MDAMERFAASAGLAALRFSLVLALPGLSPLAWAPMSIRVVLLVALALTAAFLAPIPEQAIASMDWVRAIGQEIVIGLTLALAVLLPMAAVSFFGKVVDMQAGFGAAAILNPAASTEGEALIGVVLGLLLTVLFFAMDLHHDLLRVLLLSLELLPLGQALADPTPSALAQAFGQVFALALLLVAPVLLGLLGIDLAVAYATRSMPQANVYFLSLPLKIAAGLLLLAMSLQAAPVLVERLFRTALSGSAAVLGV